MNPSTKINAFSVLPLLGWNNCTLSSHPAWVPLQCKIR